MKKNILLTSFGGCVFHEYSLDFETREDLEIFICDGDPNAKARNLTDRFIPVLMATNDDYVFDLLEKVKKHDIRMIVPGSDEEAFALMKHKEMFEKEGIVVAVQKEEYLDIMQSKISVYEYLKEQEFPVPKFRKVVTLDDMETVLKAFDYPQRPILVKPNRSRGGRGVVLLSEEWIPNKDNLHIVNRSLLEKLINGTTEFVFMAYFEGVAYDIDVLRYKNGNLHFGQRKRMDNLSKQFWGNIIEQNEEIDAFARKLYEAFPTEYLIDYDLMLTKEGQIHLLEVNPRPSGSTISYLPFGLNLYYVLVKSYLDDEHIKIDALPHGKKSNMFFKMVKGA